MNKLLFGAATAAMLVAVSPAFAVDGECKEWGCPPATNGMAFPLCQLFNATSSDS